jgi:hypothetical protein
MKQLLKMGSRGWFVLLGWSVSLLVLSGCAQTSIMPTDSAPIRGVNGHPFTQAAYTANEVDWKTQLEAVKSINANWYRVDIRVRVVNGVLDSTVQRDVRQLIDLAKGYGIRILPVLFAFDVNSDDSNAVVYDKALAAARSFSQAFASDFDFYDLDNESENYSILRQSDSYTDANGAAGVWNFGTPDGDQTWHYQPARFERTRALLSGLSAGIKAGDESAKRMFSGGWLHSGFFKRLKNDGVPFEIIGWHWYWSNIRQINGRDFIDELSTLAPEVWLTEFNRSGGDLANDGSRVPEEQATYVQGALEIYKNDPRIKALFAYELLDEPGIAPAVGQAEASYGLFRVEKQDPTCSGSKCRVRLGERKPVAGVIESGYRK